MVLSCLELSPSARLWLHSKCINKSKSSLTVKRPCLWSHTYKGPAKSTPVKENGRLSLTLKDGSGGAGGGQYGLL